MDVKAFADELVRALADTGLFWQMADGGWQMADNPTEHVEIEPLSVSDIAAHLQDVLLDMETVL